jgi:steroid 5-alpha reductase family enzyme
VNGVIGFDGSRFLVTTAVCALVVVALMALVAQLVRTRGKVSVVDVVWGLGFVSVALVSAVSGWTSSVADSSSATLDRGYDDALHDHDLRLWLLLAMVVLWGGRLAWHIGRRSIGAGEDPRYVELMQRGGLFRKVLLPQGLAIWFVSMPLQVSAAAYGTIGVLTWLGVALWLVGLVFETVGDAQLTAYKKDPQRPPVMDRGLWAWTRHPNYFGDACVWWGIFLVAADSWPGVLTVLSPVAMTFFLVKATGARLLEKTMMKREGYPEYAARTPMFFPRPPRRSAS